MKQVAILKTKVVNKFEVLINEALTNLPNSEVVGTFDRGGGTIYAIIQYDKQ